MFAAYKQQRGERNTAALFRLLHRLHIAGLQRREVTFHHRLTNPPPYVPKYAINYSDNNASHSIYYFIGVTYRDGDPDLFDKR